MEKSHLKKIPGVLTYLVILIIIIGLVLLCGVFTRLAPFLDVLIGNNHYSRGDYGQSIINYFKASSNKQYEPYIHYNLGNVYTALGETESAIDTLHQALAGQNYELIFKTNFNLANLFYESSQYSDAVDHYIEALKANPNGIEAKINLELALKKLKSQPEATTKKIQIHQDIQLKDQNQHMLDLIQKKEEELWQSQTKKEQASATQNDW